MPHQPLLKIIPILLVMALLASCSPADTTPTLQPSEPLAANATQANTSEVKVDSSPTSTPPPTLTLTATLLPPTPTPTLTPTPQWIYNEPGRVDAPILLYHKVNGDTFSNRYQVSIPNFQAQMEAIQALGYSPIGMSLFLEALLNGAELPQKPILITFDDGDLSVYEHAFPIMEAYGYPGTFYIVANRIYGSPGFVTIGQLKEMIAAGWEIGSHSYTHSDITLDHNIAPKEIGESKADLEAALGVGVSTFAYPFGKIDPFTAQKVSDYSYRAGMGLGKGKTHTWNTLFYLERIEIYGEYSLEQFIDILTKD